MPESRETRFARKHAVAGVLTATLAFILFGCAAPPAPSIGRLQDPTALRVSDHRAGGLPSSFGDTDPHEWGAVGPDSYAVHGIDAARYQGEINWPAARKAGISFAWLKATEGGDHLDPGYGLNAPRARAAGVPVGAYHFYYFCRTPSEQARWFIANVPRVSSDLPPVLDIEWNHQSRTCKRRPEAATVRADIREFVGILSRHYRTKPVIYTTPDFYEENGLNTLSNYEFWLRSVASHPSERYPGEQWTFWQYTGTGVVPGVDGIVDINAFASDTQTWQTWLALRTQR